MLLCKQKRPRRKNLKKSNAVLRCLRLIGFAGKEVLRLAPCVGNLSVCVSGRWRSAVVLGEWKMTAIARARLDEVCRSRRCCLDEGVVAAEQLTAPELCTPTSYAIVQVEFLPSRRRWAPPVRPRQPARRPVAAAACTCSFLCSASAARLSRTTNKINNKQVQQRTEEGRRQEV